MVVEHILEAWLNRRRAGVPVVEIAAAFRVSRGAVSYATAPYGPFPHPGGPQRRRLARARAEAWIAARRAGVQTIEIAADAGVSRKTVSMATAAHGPYPTRTPAPVPERVVAGWADQRRHGVPATQIAATAGIPVTKMLSLTRLYGPFPPPRKLPPDTVGICGLGQLLGVSPPTIYRWRDQGHLPDPDHTSPEGHLLWRITTLQDWIQQAGLWRCEHCGARARDPRHHRPRHQHDHGPHRRSSTADAS